MSASLAGLRVAFVAHEGFPNRKGSGTRIMEMTRALAGAGAEVTVITLPGQGPAPGHVTLRPVRVLEHNFLRRSLAFRDAVARQLVGLRPDVVHFRGPFEGEAAVAWAARQVGARSIYEVNGLPSVELRYHYPGLRDAVGLEAKLRHLEQRVATAADLRLTQSRATARFVRMRTDQPATVIPNGARPLPLPAPDDDDERPLRLLYIGALQPWQGLKDLLLAVRRAGRQIPVSLHVVGPARRSWQLQLRRMAARLKVPDLVVEDAVDKAALQERLAAADVCVAPLTRDIRNRGQGCSPIKLFEYMAAGRCVLASDLPCVREIVDHGRTGWLARPSHPHRLAEAIVHLAAQPALRRSMARRAREQIVAEATWEHRHRLGVGAYYALLGPGAGGGDTTAAPPVSTSPRRRAPPPTRPPTPLVPAPAGDARAHTRAPPCPGAAVRRRPSPAARRGPRAVDRGRRGRAARRCGRA